jgi:hypothetical protein
VTGARRKHSIESMQTDHHWLQLQSHLFATAYAKTFLLNIEPDQSSTAVYGWGYVSRADWHATSRSDRQRQATVQRTGCPKLCRALLAAERLHEPSASWLSGTVLRINGKLTTMTSDTPWCPSEDCPSVDSLFEISEQLYEKDRESYFWTIQ